LSFSQYYNFLRLGREGYTRVHHACHDTAVYLAKEIGNLGPFDIIYGGTSGLPALCWTLKDAANHGFTLYDFADRLRNRGWQVPAYSMPPNRSDLVVQRILVRHGFSHDLADLLLGDFRRTLDYFAQHPVATHLLEHEAGGHNHAGRFKRKT
jgi:glutamate decarboxylase